MSKRGYCCHPVSVCPSVCRLSHWWIVSTVRKISSNFFVGLRSHITLVFNPQLQYLIRREPFSGDAKYTGVGNRRLSRNRYEIGLVCYWTLIGSHRRRIDPCRLRWPWVTLNPGFKVKSNIWRTVCLRDKVTIAH